MSQPSPRGRAGRGPSGAPLLALFGLIAGAIVVVEYVRGGTINWIAVAACVFGVAGAALGFARRDR